MAPSGDRIRPENHSYIDQHPQNPSEIDFESDQLDADPFWFPDDANSTDTAWRYMGLAKFISILQTDSLWFSHHSKFEDPYDGIYSDSTNEAIISDYNELGLDIPHTNDENRTFGFENYVSCWNVKEEQSAALWEIYPDGKTGIAIKTTIEDLKNATETEINLPYEFNFMSGKVVYRSINDESRGHYGPVFTKRPMFDFENEYRMVFTASESQHAELSEDYTELPSKGIPVSTNLELLIDEVYVSPRSSNYVKTVVKNLRDDFGFGFDVKQSSLFTHPHSDNE